FALAESAVKGVTDVLERAREIAILGASDSFGEADRAVFAAELRGLKEQLLGLANMRDEGGRYLFAGARDGLPAFIQDAEGAVLFDGFASGPGAEAAGIERLSLPTGAELFGPDADGAFASLDRMMAALEDPDPLTRREELDGALEGIVSSHERLMVQHARMGTAMARLESETERVAAGRLEAARGLAAVKGLDLTAAISQLEALRLTLSASQQVFQRVYGASLFDRLV
ncbi:MAG: hypothetical protein SNJ79_02935, partial [Sphingomonadaceae bacterium]